MFIREQIQTLKVGIQLLCLMFSI